MSLSIPGRDSVTQSVKTGTSLVRGKFKIKKWKITLSQKEPNLGIQTDASKLSGEAFFNGVSTGVNGQKRRKTYI